ncbi:MAG: ABC transporter permease [Opitutaceae bacterium]|jgi:phospholipid/cholesterol/gamma-HCH transport system permease protein|nr:ABC transporter permease [Opitutaceae bacterium]
MSPPQASIQAGNDSGEARVRLGGDWQITGAPPSWRLLAKQAPGGGAAITALVFDMGGVGSWDTSLVLFVNTARQWCAERGARFDGAGLSPKVLALLGDVSGAKVTDATADHRRDLSATAGLATLRLIDLSGQMCGFVAECARSAFWLASHPRKLRWRDCVFEMQQCGVMGLPIVGLISFLVGVILAYVASTILRQYGADIFVADFVSLVMVREMGAMMTGVVLAGRTGAAFAAQIANMKAGEEIDALVTLGVRPVDFLVIPRILALGVMMPLLVLYSNALGILGGMVIAMVVLDIPAAAYWVEMLSVIDLSDIGTGLLKAVTFGMIVGMAGCLRGLQARRNAAGVGRAATSAVVTAILFIIMSDALFAVLFNFLGW